MILKEGGVCLPPCGYGRALDAVTRFDTYVINHMSIKRGPVLGAYQLDNNRRVNARHFHTGRHTELIL